MDKRIRFPIQRYLVAAIILKLFSISPSTKKSYRLLANFIGERQRNRYQPTTYSGYLIMREIEKYARDGDSLLEIGTGWIHRDSTFIKLFHDWHITLFDVWDNRQLKGFKHFFSLLRNTIELEMHLTPEQAKRVEQLLNSITKVNSFDELYELLDEEYVLEPHGSLSNFRSSSFQAVFSTNVLEHISQKILPKYVQDIYRLLKPGGYSVHLIDLADHFYYYDKSISAKNYLCCSEKRWKRYFENEIQYFNRLQKSEWLQLFQKSGLELVEVRSSGCADISRIRITERWRNLDQTELQATNLWIVHRKPIVN
jgi:SAM-dependent methyltransferase